MINESPIRPARSHAKQNVKLQNPPEFNHSVNKTFKIIGVFCAVIIIYLTILFIKAGTSPRYIYNSSDITALSDY